MAKGEPLLLLLWGVSIQSASPLSYPSVTCLQMVGPGWRVSFYIAAAVNTIFLGIGGFGLPKSPQQYQDLLARLAREVDWPGALTLSTSLGLLSYVFARVVIRLPQSMLIIYVLTGNVSSIKSPATIASSSRTFNFFVPLKPSL